MILIDLGIAAALAALLACLLVAPLHRRGPGPWAGFGFFFLLLFMTIWAGGIWLSPAARGARTVPWLHFLLIALFASLIVAALTPPEPSSRLPKDSSEESAPERIERERLELAFTAFFWIAILGLLAVGILGYAY